MSTEIIPRSRWREFLDEFSRVHQGWLVTVESVPARDVPGVLMRDVPLLGVSDERGKIQIATAADTSHTHRMIDAAILRVDRVGGAERGLEIESEDGSMLRLRFRSAVPAELVDGLPSQHS